jgi:hypothetical protein
MGHLGRLPRIFLNLFRRAPAPLIDRRHYKEAAADRDPFTGILDILFSHIPWEAACRAALSAAVMAITKWSIASV